MKLMLQLRPAVAAPATAEGWFLPGERAERWLEELAAAGLAEESLHLYPIPAGGDGPGIAGALAVVDTGTPIGRLPAGFACKRIGPGLWTPSESALVPELEESEVRELCGPDLLFLHPTLGLTRFPGGDGLRPSELLQLPVVKSAHWNSAIPVARGHSWLQEVVLSTPPRMGSLFESEARDIASRPPDQAPPAPEEPSPGPAAELERWVKGWITKGMEEALRPLRDEAGEHGISKGIAAWADGSLARLERERTETRQREIQRLLSLLETDPESGLRHAIPLQGPVHRGRATPGATLQPGEIDYKPGGPASGPADFWNLPASLQERLRQSYRELANRELKLGRCRRAAYIYAHLLADPLSAAGALKQGRHHREAALLYEEQLENPLEAARCLAEGGLLEEAIRRYLRLERLAEAAELHEQLGNTAAAAGLWRQLVDRSRAAGDALAAARLLEERLGSPEEALRELAAAWPASPQAVQCLGARFTLLGRMGRHDESLALVRALARGPASAPTRQLAFLEVLREQALRHPDARLRREAADLCRVAASRQLQDPASTLWSATQAVDQLIQLAPHDRLLIRDANRHLSHRRAAEVQSGRSQEAHRRPAAPRPAGTDGRSPRPIRTFTLPPALEWLAVRTESRWFYALGGNEAQTRIVRGVWEGEFQSLPAGVTLAGLRRGFTFEPTAEGGRGLALYCPSEAPVARVTFPAADLFFSQECVVETPAWLPPRALPVAYGPSAAWSLHAAAGRVVLSSHDRSGDLLQTLDVSGELLPASNHGVPAGPLCLAALPQGVAMAIDRRLLILRSNGSFMRIDLPSPAVRLFLSPAYARPGVGVAMHRGALVHWWGARDWVELDGELEEPLATFLPGGPVLLASRGECRLVNADSRGVHQVTRFTTAAEDQDLVAAVAAGEPGEFALVTRTGTVHVLATPRE